MVKTTEQQKFLDHLKNPTKALLEQAVNEFYENHRNSLHGVFVYEHYKDEYTIEVTADNHGILYATEMMLENVVAKYLKGRISWARTHPDEEENGLFRRTFFVIKA